MGDFDDVLKKGDEAAKRVFPWGVAVVGLVVVVIVAVILIRGCW